MDKVEVEQYVSPEVSIKHACGVFGIWIPPDGQDSSINPATLPHAIFQGSLPNQHRGEESFGTAVGDGSQVHKPFTSMGLIRKAYEKYQSGETKLSGHVGIGHNRYSTQGSSRIENAAPFYSECELGQVALGQNGNLINALELQEALDVQGIRSVGTTDSELMVLTIASAPGDTWEEKIEYTLKKSKGSFSLAIITKDTLFAARDAFGNRPLYLAMFENNANPGFAISSETPAFGFLGEHIRDEVHPGEIVRIDADGVSRWQWADEVSDGFCGLEIAYLMRADGRLRNRIQLDAVRRALGAKLGQLYPVADAECATYIPESSRSSAEGYAEGLSEVLGRPVFPRTSMIKGRYGTLKGSFRGFISPDDDERNLVGKNNYFPFDWLIGKKIAMVDDSIIRGTTTGGVMDTVINRVGNLRNNGAKEVHLRIPWPPVSHSCPLGTDIQETGPMIYRDLGQNLNAVAQHLGVDSLEYLTPEQFQETVDEALGEHIGLCMGCVTGEYPLSLDGYSVSKLQLENIKLRHTTS